MLEIGYWGRVGKPKGKKHITYLLNGERVASCGAHKQLVDGVRFTRTSQVVSKTEVTCGHCRRRLDKPAWCLEHLGVPTLEVLGDGQ